MPIQHVFPPQYLALAIALVLGCADVSMAQSIVDDALPSPPETTLQVQARLKAFANAPQTIPTKVTKTLNGPKGLALEKGGDDDLVTVSGRGKLIGLVDGGGGINVLQLDTVAGGKLDEICNFQDLHAKRGEWSNTLGFDGRSLIEPKAKLINTGHLGGDVHVLGGFDNQGTAARSIFVAPNAYMTNSGTAGAVVVAETARFSGSGTVESLDVAGLLEVGPAIGAPSIAKDFKLSQGATLIYGVDAQGGSATITVGGTAILNNATLRISTASGEYVGTSEHTVINASKVEGEFGQIISELAFMTATPHYLGTQVGLTYARNDVPLEAVATSDNGREFAASIEEPQPVQAATLPGVQAPAVTSPPKPAEPAKTTPVAQIPAAPLPVAQPAAKPNTAISALLGTNAFMAADAIDQLTGHDTANLANATLSSNAPISHGMLSAMGWKNPESAPIDGQIWVQAIGTSGSIGRQSNNAALKHSTTGLMLGTDWAVSPEWRLGVIGSKTQTRLDGHRFDGGLDSWYLGAYALRQDGPLALRLGAVYGDHDGSTKRHVAFNGFSDRLRGRYDANTQQVFGQMGYRFDLAHVEVEPYVHLGYQRYQRDRYQENGGDAALKVHGQTQDAYSSNLGLRLARPFVLDRGMQWTPRLNVGWKHLYGNVTGRSRQDLVSGGNTYRVEGTELDRDSLLVEAGLDLAVSPWHTLGLGYSGETGNDNRSQALMGHWRMMF
ncbi:MULTISPECIES: autotransporter domain-containing protein [unclassified Pseudomonas]|uniref:autotransporter outer membrane beta-barrel domain-containing protein n=1 Tax=unclassified Pseudomonas TaxID=196821 RepID=UPI0011AA06A2|nr:MULTISPECIES: autotransporter outer membrane beta-barrel domain-containing protein [unclassified Pseudomonas]TWC14511.1 outer membrane autotransporter protein [Pseudomonas sp. SJZ075]TWC30929.1 outer membrane autotransporter protein [Pseudomonas sp. SJZ078]TWC51967.1 outer membrane autotransporter protein [Pseudomonas sp. SJZ124]TWC87022.1 outer membrane autotransporter protein [Pseudomonas sp. SJZ101]